MSGGGGEGEGEAASSLEFTPTWVVAAVCTVIVAISLAVERFIHYAGKYLKRKNQKPLFQALQKVKEELMLLGFISLLLTVFQNVISKICVPENLLLHMLPCSLAERAAAEAEEEEHSVSHFRRRFLSEEEASLLQIGYCSEKHKVPLLSVEALHHLHIFIFILAIAHVTFCVLTVVLGGARIRQWKRWEDSVAKENYDTEQFLQKKVTHVHNHAFIRDHFTGIGKDSALLGWLHSFLKQFYASVTKADYVTLRLGFIMTHCRSNPKLNFHNYMIRALEDDFKKVVGISWYLWIFVIIFMLLNINGLHAYFWLAFIPLFLLLAVGTKLEHVISQLAYEVAEKHVAIEGELIVQPSDEHFWFGRPRIILYLIHFILFQNAFEIAYFFWILVQYGFDSCIMGQVRYIVPRLIIGVFIQVLCSYSTLPLYAIVTQMGSYYKKAIFDEHVQVGLIGWAEKVKRKMELKAAADASNSGNQGNQGSNRGNQGGEGSGNQGGNQGNQGGNQGGEGHADAGIQLGSIFRKAAASGSGPGEIQPAQSSDQAEK